MDKNTTITSDLIVSHKTYTVRDMTSPSMTSHNGSDLVSTPQVYRCISYNPFWRSVEIAAAVKWLLSLLFLCVCVDVHTHECNSLRVCVCVHMYVYIKIAEPLCWRPSNLKIAAWILYSSCLRQVNQAGASNPSQRDCGITSTNCLITITQNPCATYCGTPRHSHVM